MNTPFERYSRQIRFPAIGETGQSLISSKTVAICGLGALGTVTANGLARAGVGRIRLIDRDWVERSNLQRQSLFTDQDAENRIPKAKAAAIALSKINPEITLEPFIKDVNSSTIEHLLRDSDIILDGSDNFETRFLINDYSLKNQIPWVFASALGSIGQSMTFVPGKSVCLRCVIPECPKPGVVDSCDRAGVLSFASGAIANLQIAECLKLLVDDYESINKQLIELDFWNHRFRSIEIGSSQSSPNCPACNDEMYDWLNRKQETRVVKQCGRNSAQVIPSQDLQIDFRRMIEKIPNAQNVQSNEFLIRFSIQPYVFTVFRDGRSVIHGTEDPDEAKGLFQRYISG